ncbi:dTDP-4-dehydrorhamnose reductase [Neisseria sp.]|uniref:dTDP-4-dehydrorhamnose reductase n=1 Tax=Neisseria sp. TaxID=192066 RepID=UPI0035A14066
MRILLTGSKGQLGSCLRDRLPDDWQIIAADSATLDITDAAAVNNMVGSFQPDAVVNAAAFTAVDKAETDSAAAFAVNGTAVHNLAEAARNAQARFIHISTDYVFEGNADTPYLEHDLPNPQNVYGKSKLAGELLALAANPDSLIIRTAWVFSEYGSNFVKTMLKLAAERSEISVVADQTGCPTYAGDLAQVIIAALKREETLRGIYHYCGKEAVSWHGFAEAVFQTASQRSGSFQAPRTQAVTTADYPLPASRPAYSVMDCGKLQNELYLPPCDWREALADVVGKLL